MKTLLSLIGLAAILTTTGCETDEHHGGHHGGHHDGYRGGYHERHEYDRGHYHHEPDRDDYDRYDR